MREQLKSVELRRFLRHTRTYPGSLPFLHLDHFYYDERLKLEHFAVVRSRKALVASDHLPMLAEFSLPDAVTG